MCVGHAPAGDCLPPRKYRTSRRQHRANYQIRRLHLGIKSAKSAVSVRGLTLDKVSGLKKGDLLRVGQAHCVFEIQVALAVEVEALVDSLDNGYIDLG